MPKPTQIDHIAIATPNLSASLKFYKDQLGLEVNHIEELPDRGIRVAMLPIGEATIELIEPLHDKSEVSGYLAKRGAGIHHIALRSKDVDQDVEELKKNNVRLTADQAAPGAHNCRVAFIHPKASGGVLLELTTPPKDQHDAS